MRAGLDFALVKAVSRSGVNACPKLFAINVGSVEASRVRIFGNGEEVSPNIKVVPVDASLLADFAGGKYSYMLI